MNNTVQSTNDHLKEAMELLELARWKAKLGNSNADDVKVDKPSKNAIDDVTLVVQGKRSV
jgi:hypothetical protein|eukprot:scaffold1351_cov114-Skeletonema_marinoi.AAC.7